MAKDRTAQTETSTSTFTTEQRTQFKEGQPVEYDGKLAKIVHYRFEELPSQPGMDTHFTDTLVATLQLPALSPGGKPEYAFFVQPNKIKALNDDPKRLRALQVEYAALMGDPVPVDPAKEPPAPKIKAPNSHTKAEVPKAVAPLDLVHTPAAEGKTVVTNKAGEPKAAKSKGAKGETPKSSKKTAKK